jgi:hypothetical protein
MIHAPCTQYVLLRYRWMLLNYYTKPPQYDADLARWASSFMPIIILLHCAFAVWIYGNATIFDR